MWAQGAELCHTRLSLGWKCTRVGHYTEASVSVSFQELKLPILELNETAVLLALIINGSKVVQGLGA